MRGVMQGALLQFGCRGVIQRGKIDYPVGSAENCPPRFATIIRA